MSTHKIMVRAHGTFRNPMDKNCFDMCPSCHRCSNKDRFNCGNTCSGRDDPRGQRQPDIDDLCRCKEGILQWVRDDGRMIGVKMKTSPFAGVVKYDTLSQDEADWESYLKDMREKLDNELYDPIQFTDGSGSVGQHIDNARNLRG